jgi:hypothetical protein
MCVIVLEFVLAILSQKLNSFLNIIFEWDNENKKTRSAKKELASSAKISPAAAKFSIETRSM